MRSRVRHLRAPLASPAFARLWVAQLLSELGDWSARVALAVLVFERTGSEFYTALAGALSLLPFIGMGQWLAARADRWPRTRVLVGTDLVRAGAFALVIFDLPIGLTLAFVFVAGLATPPFEAARAAIIPEIVPPKTYDAALALTSITFQFAVIGGYLAGGGLVGTLGPSVALGVNAATFVLSALFLTGLKGQAEGRLQPTKVVDGLRAVLGDRFVLRALLLTMVGGSTAIIAEYLVAVYVLDELGASRGTIGPLAAVVPLGTVLATFLIRAPARPATAVRITTDTVLVGSVIALAGFLVGGWPGAVIGLFGSGVVFASALPANTLAGTRFGTEVRTAVFAVCQGAVMVGQGLGSLAGGVVASSIGVRSTCIAAAALAALVAAVAVFLPVRRQAFAIDLRAADRSGEPTLAARR